MRIEKKAVRLTLAALTMVFALLSSGPALAASGQQVKIPYVVSMPGSGWWTGIAITNNANATIADMEILFTTTAGISGHTIFAKTSAGGLDPAEVFEPIPGPVEPMPIYVNYSTELDEIAPYAMLVNTLDGFYAGDSGKTLPAETGSITLYHSGSAAFSVTVYIGSPEGFAFQVFHSTAP